MLRGWFWQVACKRCLGVLEFLRRHPSILCECFIKVRFQSAVIQFLRVTREVIQFHHFSLDQVTHILKLTLERLPTGGVLAIKEGLQFGFGKKSRGETKEKKTAEKLDIYAPQCAETHP